MIYFDSAATSYPKPKQVIDKVVEGLTVYNANPGRGSYDKAIDASIALIEVRQKLAAFFGLDDYRRMIFANNTTDALNMALLGLLEAGDHVIISPLEHNSVYRPMGELAKIGVEYTIASYIKETGVDVAEVESLIKENTKMLAFTLASNVTGNILPIAELGALARKHDILLLVDGAQGAGLINVDMQAMNIDLLAFPGHKSLYGPMGSGGLCVGERALNIKPIKTGGTGSKSHSQEHPMNFPDRLECGTLALPAIIGMGAGVDFVNDLGVANIFNQQSMITDYFLQKLKDIPEITTYCPETRENRAGIVTLTVEGFAPGELAGFLNEEYELAVRAGYHCSPLAHQSIGTFETGAVRFSFSYKNTIEEIDVAITALKAAVRKTK